MNEKDKEAIIKKIEEDWGSEIFEGMSANDIDTRLESIKKMGQSKCKCSDVFTEEERQHLEEVLQADLDGYYEELKDIGLDDEFKEWKKLSNKILKKCKLNSWEIPAEPEKPEHIQKWEEWMKRND